MGIELVWAKPYKYALNQIVSLGADEWGQKEVCNNNGNINSRNADYVKGTLQALSATFVWSFIWQLSFIHPSMDVTYCDMVCQACNETNSHAEMDTYSPPLYWKFYTLLIYFPFTQHVLIKYLLVVSVQNFSFLNTINIISLPSDSNNPSSFCMTTTDLHLFLFNAQSPSISYS